jgi:hypothetical protein
MRMEIIAEADSSVGEGRVVGLMSPSAREYGGNSFEQDFEIQPNRPVVDIK